MIGLNSVMALTTRAITIFLTVGISTPVVNNVDVVRMAGVSVSTYVKVSRWPASNEDPPSAV